MTEDNARKITRWKVADLRPHPRQDELFAQPTQQEIEELATLIERQGMSAPIEILPDCTIICGHRRTAAAKLLGWIEIDVWVRDDLQQQGAAAIEERLIWDNLARRQMGPLEMAHCYRSLKLSVQKRKTGRLTDNAKAELRDQIGQRLGISGRNLDRYLRVLDHTPHEVQDAVAANKLPITIAEKVAGLPKESREQIAQQIRDGGEAGEVVRRHVVTARGPHKKARDARRAFITALQRGIEDLDGRADKVGRFSDQEKAILELAEKLIKKLRMLARKQPAKPRSVMEALAPLLEGRETSLDEVPGAGGETEPTEPPANSSGDRIPHSKPKRRK